MRMFALLSAVAVVSVGLNSIAQADPMGASSAYQPRIISADDATADVALLRRGLETVHPGLYRYSTRKQIDAAFAKLEAAAARPIAELALHAEIALMLATIHCDHTKAEMSDALIAWRNANPTHLPFRFRLIEGRMIVISTDGQAGAPPVGSEILKINGMAVPVLMLKLAPTVAYDGDTDQAIAVKLGDDSDLQGDDFNEYFPSFFGFPASWKISWKAIGAPTGTDVTLAPVTFARWTELPTPDGAYRNEFYKSVTWRMAGKVARLKIDTFVNYRNPVQPTAFLGGFFRAMKAAGTDHLILDLRNNGGGSEDVSIALGRYLFDQPFTWSKPTRYKAIRYGDLPQYISSWGDTDALFNPPADAFAKTSDGWFDRKPVQTLPETSDDESDIEHLPIATDHFAGRLTVLTGPQNGSGATRTIAQLKQRRGAILVGEDSAGSAEGPTSGQIFLMTLPKSGLKVRIANAWNRTNIDRWVPRMGVPADVTVVPTLADFQANRDRALEVARGLSAPTSPLATSTDALFAPAVRGHWTGTLDYRDYGNDGRVVLPTILDSDGTTLSWTYDDGPGKIIRSTDEWTINPVAGTVTIREGKSQTTSKIVEYRSATDGSMTLIFDRTGEENGRKMLFRSIMTATKGQLRLTQLSRTPGTPFLMRHSYELHQ